MSCCLGKDEEKKKLADHVLTRDVTAHPSDARIGLSATAPLYPPGTIIHVVRTHPPSEKGALCCDSTKPVYQAVWANNADFDEVLISPTMINDHMPDSVLDALERVLVKVGPPKPVRTLTEAERKVLLSHDSLSSNHSSPLKDGIEMNFSSNWCSASNTHSSVTNDCSTADHQWEDIPLHSPIRGKTVMDFEEDLISEGSDGDRCSETPRQHHPLALKLSKFKVETAPLASPETLSASSSLAFIGAAGDGKTYRLQPSFSELETITQSPEHGVQNDVSSNLPSSHVSSPNNGEPFNKSEVENMCSSNTDSNLNSTNEKDRCEKEVTQNFNIDAVVTVCEPPPQQKHAPQINNCVTHPAENATKPEAAFTIGNEEGKFTQHSPDECTQFEYGNPNVHYSPAGTGYPHGAYQPPVNSSDISSCAPPSKAIHADGVKSKHHPPMRHCTSAGALLQPAIAHIRRSPEMTNIACNDDNAMVFEGSQIKEEMSFDIEQDLQESGTTSSSSGAKIFDFVTTEAEIV